VLWRRSDALLRRSVLWDASAWGTVDPATLLSTSCLVIGAGQDPEREAAVFALEHHEREPLRLLDLAVRTPPAGGLHEATGGRPETAPRWARLLQPLGFATTCGSRSCAVGVLGSLYAYRRDGTFTAAEWSLLARARGGPRDAATTDLAPRRGADRRRAGSSHGLLLVAPEARSPGDAWAAVA
jgi:hypothetical protein